MLPSEVNILGVKYTIQYVDNPTDVDIFKRESLWGQIDYWTRTIRIYRNGRSIEDIWESLLHEIIHGIVAALRIRALQGVDNEDAISLLALGLADTLFRNGWLKFD